MKQTTIQLHNRDFYVFEDDYITKSLSDYGCWEPNETDYLAKVFNSNKQLSFCDVGAHYGYFTALHESISNADSLSIEANPVTYMMCLKHNVKNARHIMIGSGSESNEVFRICDNGNSGGSGGKVGLPILMKTCPLSALPIYDVYKIDIEGSELTAIQSLLINGKIPRKIRQIMVEITLKCGTHDAIISLLRDNDFELLEIPHKECGLLKDAVKPVPFVECQFNQFNLVGVRK